MSKKMTRQILVVLVLLVLALTQVSDAQEADLAGWWKLDGNANDSSGNENHGTLSGNLQWVEGKIGGALDFAFAGADDYVDCGSDPSLDINGPITISSWFFPTGSGSSNLPRIVAKADGASGALPGYQLYLRSNDNYILTLSAGGIFLKSKSAAILNTWNYAAFIVTGTKWKLFLNGTWEEFDQSEVASSSSNPLLIGNNPDGGRNFQGMIDDLRIYSRALTEEEVLKTMRGRPETASEPIPPDASTDVPTDVVLSWTPGEFANTHDVYLGTVVEDVNDADRNSPLLVSRSQADTSYDHPERLEFGTNYFWRIDEVNSLPDLTTFKGDLWSFTTEPVSYLITDVKATASGSSNDSVGPENTVDQSGLTPIDNGPEQTYVHDAVSENMWQSAPSGFPADISFEFDRAYKLHNMKIWNHNTLQEEVFGLGAREVSIEIADSSAGPWNPLAEVSLNKAPGSPGASVTDTIDMMGQVASNVRLTISSNHGGLVPMAGLAEVQFFYIPVVARELEPADGTALDDVDVILAWRSGREAAQHQVYLDSSDNLALVETSDPAALVATLEGNGSYASYTASALNLSNTYVWKIVEVSADETAAYDSPVLSFTTPQYLIVDDFEAYTDDMDAGKAIFQTWADGYEKATNGSLVGHDFSNNGTFGETTFVHEGSQSMPLFFDNTGVSLSEATRTFAQARDWSRSGITTLSLFVRQDPDNIAGNLYVEINSDKVPLVNPSTYPPGFDPGWIQYNIDLTKMNVSNVQNLTIGVEGAGSQGLIYIDDIRLYAEAPDLPPAMTFVAPLIEAESGTITPPLQVFDDLMSSGGAYIRTEEGTGNANSEPPADGVATYSFTVPEDGVYRLFFRVSLPSGGDSFWVRIPGMVTNRAIHESGWVRFNDISDGQDWHWDEVHSSDDGLQAVEFTLSAGVHTLEIARREHSVLLDAIAVFGVD